MKNWATAICLLFALVLMLVSPGASAAAKDKPTSGRFDALYWRCIGPYRGGRTVGIDGVWTHPNVFFIGVNNGGVWKTDDAGRTWNPIFDDQDTGSIGCLAIAQSNPNVIYVGSGEGLHRPDLSVGDGIYKSVDGGKHWVNTGLRDGQQIGGLCVDPHNPNRAFAAVLGHPYGPNTERGVFRTLNGGATWERVLYRDADTGAMAVAIDPVHPATVYASLLSAREAPWENGHWQGTTSGLFKSVDGGSHWKPLTRGLPGVAEGLGRIGFTICRKNPDRIYATVDARTNGGIYRSDDAGASWVQTCTDLRVWGRGEDFGEVRVDPLRPDVVYAANTSVYESTDAGKTFQCIKGSPGGDDYHTIWINPLNTQYMGLASDQGACISVNSGDTWSSWYNQPTAQLYHVSADNQIPYSVYAGQQESGSVGISSRGIDGQITFRDWHPVGAEEYAYVAPDPLHPNLIYASKGSRYDKNTGRIDDVHPKIPGLRYLRTMPMLFSPIDPHTLYLASNRLLKTTDGGSSWTAISPDLSRETWTVPASYSAVGHEGSTMKRRGVVYAVGPSPVDANVIWCGTDDGLVWITRDAGTTWSNVTPPQVDSWSKVSQIDAGHSQAGTAYVSVNRLRCDDLRPYIYRTTDFGATWSLIVNGLEANAPVNTVREDPLRPNLLFAGTEHFVAYSLDAGLNWKSLRLNMPATSIRDLIVKDDDLVVATHGRSFWILDSIAALRSPDAVIAAPERAYLFDWNLNSDTPLPPDEPVGKNPPDGVPIDYYLAQEAKKITLEVLDATGKVVRSFDSSVPGRAIDPKRITVDPRWARPPQVLGLSPGSHRFVWDLRLSSSFGDLGMAAVWHDTPAYRGALVPPGRYTLRLRIDGKGVEAPLVLMATPSRVK